MQGTEQDIKRLIEKTLTEEREAEELATATETKLETIRTKLHAFGITYEALLEEAGTKHSENGVMERLGGLTQIEGLLYLARRNGGVIKTKDVADLLFRAGKIRTRKNAYGIVLHLIADLYPSYFQKVAPGTYKVVQGKRA